MALGRELGIADDKIEGVADWRHTNKLTEQERLVVELADVLTATPVVMSEELSHRLSQHFSDRQLVDLTNTIAWENCRARFNRGLGVEADNYSD